MFNNVSQYGGYGGYGGYTPMPSMPSTPSYSTYTPSTGNTNAGTQLASLQKLLASITGTVPQTPDEQALAEGQSQAGAQSTQMQGNQQDWQNQNTQSLIKQSGIPQLQGQQADLAKIYELYSHDLNLQAGKFTQGQTGNLNPYQDPTLIANSSANMNQLQQGNQADIAKVSQMTTPNQPGATIAAPSQPTGGQANPYLASTDAIVSGVANAPQNPNLTTGEMGQTVGGATSLMDLLTNLIGAQQGLVGQQSGVNAGNYQSKMSALASLSNAFGTGLTNLQAKNAPGSIDSIKNTYDSIVKDAKSGMTLHDIMATYTKDPSMTVDKIMQLYNSNSKYGPAKEDATSLARLYGVSGGFAKAPSAAELKAEAASQKGVDSLRNFNDIMSNYYDTTVPLGDTHIAIGAGPWAPTAGYFTGRDLYARAIGKQLGASRSQLSYESITGGLPGAVESSSKAEQKFKAHLSTLMDATGLRMGIGKDGNYQIMDSSSFDPNQFKKVDINKLPIQTVRDILGGL